MSLVSTPSAVPVVHPVCAAPLPIVPAATFDHLAIHGWAMHDSFLPAALVQRLADECEMLQRRGDLKPARVGRAHAQAAVPQLRGDQIRWLEWGQSSACDAYLQLMESLRVGLNETFFLGLHNYESHFAHYAPGRGYAKHLDRFQDDDHRVISVVLYLNADWQDSDGGALRIHGQGERLIDVHPRAGRLAIFRSADVLHEVLPATRDRLSLAGWFRRRDLY